MAYKLLADTSLYAYIDWSDDGIVYPGDWIADDVLPGASSEIGRDQGRLTGGPKVPAGQIALLNEQRIYSSTYSGSPLRGHLRPGHRAVVGRVIGNDDPSMDDAVASMNDPQLLMDSISSAPIITGRNEEPRETYEWGHRVATVGIYGMAQRLIDAKVTIGYQASIRTGAAVVLVLTAAGFSAAEYVIDGSSQVSGRQMLHWYVDNQSAWDVLKQIWATEGPPAALYEDTQGRINWEGRTYRATIPRFLNVQQTFTDTDPIYYFHGIEYEQAYDSVVNDMTLETEQWVLGGSAVKVWEYGGGAFNLTAGASTTFVASTDAALVSPQTPSSPTDFTVTIGSLAAVALTQLGPKSVQVMFTAGGAGAQVSPPAGGTGWQLRALPLTLVSTTTTSGTIDVTVSQSTYGKRAPKQEIQGAIWKSLSGAEAAGLIDGYLTNYADPRGVVRLTVRAENGLLLHEILSRSISDRIHVYDSWSGIDYDLSIEQIAHKIDTLNAHEVVWSCEKIFGQDYAQWDVAQWDVDLFGQ